MSDLLHSKELLAAFFGALMGGLFTWAGICWEHRWVEHQAKKETKRHLLALLQGFHDEIDVLWNHYMETVGSFIEKHPPNQPFLGLWPVYQDYFTIYNGNSIFIGQVEDAALRKKIVTAYSLAKAHIDGFRMNNDLVQKYELAAELASETEKAAHISTRNGRLNALVDYAEELKRSHVKLQVAVSDLFAALTK